MKYRASGGFTATEIMVVLAIMIILVGSGLYAFISARKKANVTTTGDAIAAVLEAAKENAITGYGGSAYGVKFNSTSYVTFTGTSWSAGNPTNSTTTVPSDITITTTLPGPDYAIIFAHLSGTPNVTGTITVTGQASSTLITVGTLGDITVVK